MINSVNPLFRETILHPYNNGDVEGVEREGPRLIRERKPNGDAECIVGCVYTTNGQIDVNINQLTRGISAAYVV